MVEHPQAMTASLSSFERGNPLSQSNFRGYPNVVSHPDRSPGFADPSAKLRTAVVISDVGTDDVYAFTTRGVLAAKITGFSYPEALARDSFGNIYVANANFRGKATFSFIRTISRRSRPYTICPATIYRSASPFQRLVSSASPAVRRRAGPTS